MNKLQINVRKNGRGNHGWTIQTQVTLGTRHRTKKNKTKNTAQKQRITGAQGQTHYYVYTHCNIISGFSLTNFLSPDYSVGDTLPDAKVTEVLNKLGIISYIEDKGCSSSSDAYSPNYNGWSKGIDTISGIFNFQLFKCLSSHLRWQARSTNTFLE